MKRNKKILNGFDLNKYEPLFGHKALDRLEVIPFISKPTKWITENTNEKI